MRAPSRCGSVGALTGFIPQRPSLARTTLLTAQAYARLMGAREVLPTHHTDCGILTPGDDDAKGAIEPL